MIYHKLGILRNYTQSFSTICHIVYGAGILKNIASFRFQNYYKTNFSIVQFIFMQLTTISLYHVIQQGNMYFSNNSFRCQLQRHKTTLYPIFKNIIIFTVLPYGLTKYALDTQIYHTDINPTISTIKNSQLQILVEVRLIYCNTNYNYIFDLCSYCYFQILYFLIIRQISASSSDELCAL